MRKHALTYKINYALLFFSASAGFVLGQRIRFIDTVECGMGFVHSFTDLYATRCRFAYSDNERVPE